MVFAEVSFLFHHLLRVWKTYPPIIHQSLILAFEYSKHELNVHKQWYYLTLDDSYVEVQVQVLWIFCFVLPCTKMAKIFNLRQIPSLPYRKNWKNVCSIQTEVYINLVNSLSLIALNRSYLWRAGIYVDSDSIPEWMSGVWAGMSLFV